MSAFQPTSITLDPPADEDPRRTALVAALERHLGYQLTWHLPVVLVAGIATAGLGPLIVLLLRFSRFAKGETFQLEHVSEWHGRHAAQPHAMDKVPDVSSVWLMLGFAIAVLAIAAAVLQAHFLGQGTLSLWCVYAWNRISPTVILYPAVLTVGYLLLGVAIEVRARAVRRSIESFNAIRMRRMVSPVAVPEEDPIALLPWVIVGTVLMLCGAFWGFAMMLAAGLHRRYINDVSRDVRAQLARRIKG